MPALDLAAGASAKKAERVSPRAEAGVDGVERALVEADVGPDDAAAALDQRHSDEEGAVAQVVGGAGADRGQVGGSGGRVLEGDSAPAAVGSTSAKRVGGRSSQGVEELHPEGGVLVDQG